MPLSILTTICLGCDPANDPDDSPGSHGTGSSDDGAWSDSEMEVCAPTSEIGPSLLDHAYCTVPSGNDVVPVAACGTADSRLRPCDDQWVSYCDATLGGDIVACDDEDPVMSEILEGTLACSSTSPLLPPCDAYFVDSCDAMDYVYVFQDDTGSQGSCEPGVVRGVSLCCGGQKENSEGVTVFTGCSSKAGLGSGWHYNHCDKTFKAWCDEAACNQDGQCTC